MKKFISFVMAGAMVASLVPATAFAAGEVKATVKVVDALNLTRDDASNHPYIVEDTTNISAGNGNNGPTDGDHDRYANQVPELQMTITNTDYRHTQPEDAKLDVTLSLDNATFTDADGNPARVAADFEQMVSIRYTADRGGSLVKSFQENEDADLNSGNVLWDSVANEEVSDNVSRDFADVQGAEGIEMLIADATDGYGFGQDFDVSTNGTEKIFYNASANFVADGTGVVEIYDGATLKAPYDDAEEFWAIYKKVLDGTGTFQDAANGTKKLTQKTGAVCDATGQFRVTLNDMTPTATDVTAATTTDATFKITVAQQLTQLATVITGLQRGDYVNAPGDGPTSPTEGIKVEAIKFDEDEVTFRFTGKFAKDDIIIFDMLSLLDKTGEGRQATVSVSSDAVEANDLVYVSIEGRGITAAVKKLANVAEEEYAKLDKDLTIKSSVGDFVDGQWFELKLSKGFEFTDKTVSSKATEYKFGAPDGNTIFVKYIEEGNIDHDRFTIKANDIEIEATSAKSGATATITVKAVKGGGTGAEYDNETYPDVPAGAFSASTTVEVMKVVDYKVLLSVDSDEDVPEIYSGVNVDNYGITDDSDHLSLEVTAEETFPGAWSFRKGFNFELPEGVYVTDLKVNEVDGLLKTKTTADNTAAEVKVGEVYKAFFDAYQDGSHVNFEFDKRVFDDVDSVLNKDEAKMVFQLELVADPGFEGDVVLKLTGDLVDAQEVTIAKFVKPYEVKAEQNDMIIDYRYTDIPTAITITEAEKGLWAKDDATFNFTIEKSDLMSFEGDPTFEVDSKSDMELKKAEADDGEIHFTVKTESDEAATITIKDMQLFMNRSIPAGPYKLKIGSSLATEYKKQVLFAPDHQTCNQDGDTNPTTFPKECASGAYNSAAHNDTDKDCYVGDVCDYSTTVKDAFVNVVTAGRDVDDASFTTKVVVPVGESYIVAGEKQVDLDTPAYINAAGYTMLPIRAVATALGISNNNVLWDQPTHTVTILYGQRIITMTQGQKVVYVNGSAIPASAAVENTNSRTFLPMRDLATALGVTDITWDQATRTATLNGNQK